MSVSIEDSVHRWLNFADIAVCAVHRCSKNMSLIGHVQDAGAVLIGREARSQARLIQRCILFIFVSITFQQRPLHCLNMKRVFHESENPENVSLEQSNNKKQRFGSHNLNMDFLFNPQFIGLDMSKMSEPSTFGQPTTSPSSLLQLPFQRPMPSPTFDTFLYSFDDILKSPNKDTSFPLFDNTQTESILEQARQKLENEALGKVPSPTDVPSLEPTPSTTPQRRFSNMSIPTSSHHHATMSAGPISARPSFRPIEPAPSYDFNFSAVQSASEPCNQYFSVSSPNGSNMFAFPVSADHQAHDPRMMKTNKRSWTPEEDALLIDGFKKYGRQWSKICELVPGRTNQQVKQRYSYVLDSKIKNGQWTEEEDNSLREAVEMFGKCWAKVAQMVPGRTNIQCRNRWKDVLDPSIRTDAWTPEEDQLLESYYQVHGNRWSKIAQMIPGRTGLQCRDRFVRGLKRNPMKPI